MRSLFLMILPCALVLAGCAEQKPADPPVTPPARAGAAGGARPNGHDEPGADRHAGERPRRQGGPGQHAARFVVLNFPLGKMAAVEQRLNLYRRGLKVGEVKVTGPQREDNTVADLVAGEAEVGDEARSQ